MAGKYGVEQLSKIILLVAELGNVVEKVLSGGGFLSFLQLSPELLALASLNGEQFKLELGELDADDKAKLLTTFKAKLNLGDDKLEEKFEAAADLVVQVSGTIGAVVVFVQSLKS